jgi:hypothetical protein
MGDDARNPNSTSGHAAMSRYTFMTDEKSKSYCDEIVTEQVQRFGISEEEAVGRLNRVFTTDDLRGYEHELYREYPEDWAMSLYYGHAYWLTPESERKPIPYP